MLPLLATLSTFFGILPPMEDKTTFEFRGDVQNVLSGMIPGSITTHTRSAPTSSCPREVRKASIVAESDYSAGSRST